MKRTYSRSHANRGAGLEQLIDMTNKQYRNKGVALIDKVPNAWTVQRAGKKIISAFPQRKTGVDYVGVSHGKAIALEAKTTTNRTSFPLSMLQDHQIEFLQQFEEQGGKSYCIIEFSKLGEIYIAPFGFLNVWIKQAQNGGRKSIPHSEFVEMCDLVKSDKGYVLHYLKHVG